MGYSALWRLFRVNPDTWADAEEVLGVDSAKVERSGADGDSTIEAATVTLSAAPTSTFAAGWHRLVLYATADGSTERHEVMTMWCDATKDDNERGVASRELTGRSVIYPASVAILALGSYCPKGSNGAEWAASMLRSVIPAAVSVEGGGFEVSEHVVFDDGTSVLDAVWQVLDAGGYMLRISGHGEVTVAPVPTDPALVLDRAAARLLMPKVSRELDYSEVPNRYVVSREGAVVEVTNDLATSPTSTTTRGWRHDVLDTSPTLVNGESLYGYAVRRLTEESTVKDTRTYEREWVGNVFPGDLVRGSIPSVGLEGDLRVVRQSLDCGHGIKVTEEACKEVQLWTA